MLRRLLLVTISLLLPMLFAMRYVSPTEVTPAMRRTWLMSGASLGERITNCVAVLPSNEGVCDARGEPNTTQGLGTSGDVIIPSGVELRLGNYQINVIGGNELEVQGGGTVICASPDLGGAGTTFFQQPGATGPAIRAQSAAGPSGWWHAGRIEGCRINGNKSNRTAGLDQPCMFVESMGEASSISNIRVFDCPAEGILLDGGAAGEGTLRGISTFTNGTYGIRVNDMGNSNLVCLGCGGDDNTDALIALTGTGEGTFTCVGCKSESPSVGVTDIFLIDKTAGTVLNIIGGSATCGGGTCTNIVHRESTSTGGFALNIAGFFHTGYTNILNDEVTGDVRARGSLRFTSQLIHADLANGEQFVISGPNAVVRDGGAGFGDLKLDGSSGGCLMLRDTDDAGWTRCTALNGTLSCATDADGVC